ncbi:MAG: hypothetical protein MZV70_49845 [Desulfobacterales bacterium]|nr:hypothetical protein [Desulfobacterales bacterium]
MLGVLCLLDPEAARLRVGRDPGRPDLADDVRRRGAARATWLTACVAGAAAGACVIMFAGYRMRAGLSFLDPWQYSAGRGLPDRALAAWPSAAAGGGARASARACRSSSTCPSRTPTSSSR